MSFKKFTIYGERCSGTNFIRKLIFDNFDLNMVYLPDNTHGWKHFFGHFKNLDAIRDSKDVVILSIVRNPIDNLMSFWENPHHQSAERKTDITTFLTGEFWSIYPEPPFDEVLLDRYFAEEWRRYKNVFEMRAVKNRIMAGFSSLTPNHVLVKYEDLKADPTKYLLELEAQFGLKRLLPELQVETKRILPQSKGWFRFELSNIPPKENYEIDAAVKEIFRTHLDFDAEALVGYSRESIEERLK